MKMKTIAIALVLIGVQAQANYGIKPPVTGSPNTGNVSIPRNPGAGSQPSVGIGQHEQIQFVVSSVLKKAAVKSDRVAKYKKALVKIAFQEKEVMNWLNEVNDYLDSQKFNNQSDSQKNQDRFDCRLLIEMTIGQFEPSATE